MVVLIDVDGIGICVDDNNGSNFAIVKWLILLIDVLYILLFYIYPSQIS